MAQVTLPFVIHNGDPGDADQVIADLNAILNQVNGNLQGGVNVKTAAPQPQNGSTGAEGSSDSLLRADASFVIRGVEQLTADPTTGNSEGRVYYNSTTNQLRLCTDPTGVGTFVTFGNITAADLPNHASRHATGGPDPLPANSVDQTMWAKRAIISGVPTGDVNLTSGAWTDFITGVSVTTTGTAGQLCHFNLNASFTAGSNAGNVNFRIVDDQGLTVFRTGANAFGPTGGNNDQKGFHYSKWLNVTGTRVYKVQASVGVSGAQINKSMGPVNGESGLATELQVVVG